MIFTATADGWLDLGDRRVRCALGPAGVTPAAAKRDPALVIMPEDADTRALHEEYGFAQAVVAAAGLEPEIVRPTTSEAFTRPAPRPSFSVLDHGSVRAAGVPAIGDWRERWAVAAAAALA